MTEQKPREFWITSQGPSNPCIVDEILPNGRGSVQCFDADNLRVIETSAYDQALTRIKELEDDYANMVRSDFNRFNAKCESDGKLYRAQELLDVAVKALEVCANRGYCRSYECCANCGPIYEAEEALAKIGQTK